MRLSFPCSPGRAFKVAVSVMALSSIGMPLSALALSGEGASGYAASVFDKLQGQWQSQAVENPVSTNTQLTFTLKEDGSLTSSHVDGAQLGDEANAHAVMDLLTKHAPFGAFPKSLQGAKLTFHVKLSPNSLQMTSYQIVSANKPEPVVSYVASASPQPAPLFYTRILPAGTGRIMEKSAQKSSGAQPEDQGMSSYVVQVQEQVRQHWQLPQDYEFKRTVAQLMIDRNGALLGAQITQGSGDKTVDRAALKAITSAAPFPQAPDNVSSLPVTIEYVFEPVHESE